MVGRIGASLILINSGSRAWCDSCKILNFGAIFSLVILTKRILIKKKRCNHQSSAVVVFIAKHFSSSVTPMSWVSVEWFMFAVQNGYNITIHCRRTSCEVFLFCMKLMTHSWCHWIKYWNFDALEIGWKVRIWDPALLRLRVTQKALQLPVQLSFFFPSFSSVFQ